MEVPLTITIYVNVWKYIPLTITIYVITESQVVIHWWHDVIMTDTCKSAIVIYMLWKCYWSLVEYQISVNDQCIFSESKAGKLQASWLPGIQSERNCIGNIYNIFTFTWAKWFFTSQIGINLCNKSLST